MNLLEKYSKRVKLAESVYAKRNPGEAMDSLKKLTVAQCIENINRFLNESFGASTGTQQSALGDYKKFCIALTNVGLPSLIAMDIVATSPMTSINGSIAYVKYVRGIDKGEAKSGDLVNDMWYTGNVQKDYTGDAVKEAIAGTETKPGWGNLHKGAFIMTGTGTAPGTRKYDANGVLCDEFGHPIRVDMKVVKADGSEVYFIATDEVGTFGNTMVTFTKDTTGVITETSGIYTPVAGDQLYYRYDNITVPQAELPTLRAEMANIPLYAKARRIAVFYSQIAAFQA